MPTDLTPGEWQEVERLYHRARDLTEQERATLLEAECADAGVRSEVESLLQYDVAADGYLERPALEAAAASLVFDRGPLPAGRRIGGYEVRSFLGAGGMGEVYLARDVRLERDVALKVLERFVASDPEYLRRFEEEARAASGLTHPNIVTIYGVGEDDGVAYIAMELVRGRTLRAVLSAEGVALEQAIDLAAQLAEALAAAHAAGIVHRDLKPENLMVTAGGLLKVLDFGIAKRRHTVTPDAGLTGGVESRSDTARSAISGTLGYMSPEQAAGRPVDHRSDLFSLGAILYEMLNRRQALDQDSAGSDPQTNGRAAVTSRAPVPADVPAPLRDLVDRCLAADAEARDSNSHDVAIILRQLQEELRYPTAGRPVTRRRALWMVGAATLSTAAGVAAWSRWSAGPAVASLAVLPFTNVDRDPAIDYLCDGITDSLIRRVAYVPDLSVRPRSTVFNFKHTGVDARAAGRQLGVDAVMTGTVTASAGRLVVTVELIDVATGEPTWSDRYERPASDLLTLQHDLAIAILDEGIRRKPDASVRRQFERGPTEDGEANDLFLRGVYRHRIGGEDNYLVARGLLAQAVAKDPTFALAFVSLASTFTVMTIDGYERPTTAWPESNRNIRRALEIDPAMPEAHAERASSWFFFDHDWEAAEREWNRALEAHASPALPDLLSGAALKLWALGRADEALALARRARTLDPLTPALAAQEADLLLHVGRLDAAARIYSDVLSRVPGNAEAWFGLAETRRAQGDYDQAIAALQRGHGAASDGSAGARSPLFQRAHGASGYRELERAAVRLELEQAEAYLARGGYVSPLDLARGYARLADAERAFVFLDLAFEENAPGLVFLNVDRAWDALRGDDRLAAAARAVGLPVHS